MLGCNFGPSERLLRQVGSLEFQHLDADFSTSKAGFAGNKFKRRCSKLLFWREQLN